VARIEHSAAQIEHLVVRQRKWTTWQSMYTFLSPAPQNNALLPVCAKVRCRGSATYRVALPTSVKAARNEPADNPKMGRRSTSSWSV